MCISNHRPPRQRKTIRKIIEDLIRYGHLEVYEVTERMKDAVDQPPCVTTAKLGTRPLDPKGVK